LLRQRGNTLLYIEYGNGSAPKAFKGEEASPASSLAPVPVTSVLTRSFSFIQMQVDGKELIIDRKVTEEAEEKPPGVLHSWFGTSRR
jgi:hypothetical protein